MIARETVPEELRVIATAADDHEIMAVQHRRHPVVGVQFHPESAASEHGYAMLDRFLRGDRSRAGALPPRADGAPAAPQARRPWGDETSDTFVPPPVERVR